MAVPSVGNVTLAYTVEPFAKVMGTMDPLTTLPPDRGARSQSKVPVVQESGDAANAGAAEAKMIVGTAHAVPAMTLRREIPACVGSDDSVVRSRNAFTILMSLPVDSPVTRTPPNGMQQDSISISPLMKKHITSDLRVAT
ncbi:hypothetical protein ACFOLD_03555 [Kocuria carniphila]|uniref:hypothetical protein n=1 Tax=Kocuria carniphila TaxID=262208 RepID=UPI003618FEC0